MASVLRIGGYRVVIHTNDHRPAHVHVIGAGNEAIVRLNCPEGPPELLVNRGFGRGELRRTVEALASEVAALCDAWRRMHGPF